MNFKLKLLVGITLASFIVIIVSVFAGSYIYLKRSTEAKNEEDSPFLQLLQNGVPGQNGTTDTSTGTNVSNITTSSLTAAVVALHNTPSDCWMIINNKVYSLAPFLNSHPGGALVMTPYCGKEATNAFDTKDKKPATKHSEIANSMLVKFFIGVLGQEVPTSLSNNGTTNPTNGTSTIVNGIITNPTPTLFVTPTPTPLSTPIPTPIPTQSGITTSTVATHNTSSNCWIILGGKAYNVTSYLTQHPGGVSVITKYCGKEATNAFNTKDGSGSSHSSYAVSLLNSYFVGNVSGSSSGGVSTPTPTPVPTNTGGGSTPTPTPTPAPTPTGGGGGGSTPTPTPTPAPTPIPTQASGYTTAQVATHNSNSNCWLIISSKVYNVTGYLTQHPGGVSVITAYCGKEATNAFNTKGGRGSSHSNTAKNLLNNFYIGNIVANPTPTPTPTPTGGGGGGSTPTPTPTPTSTSTPTPTPTQSTNCGSGVPSVVCAKYPGATLKKMEDNQREMEILYQGACRHVILNSSGSISSDTSC